MKNNINFYEKGSVEILCSESMHSFPLHSHESFCVGIVTEGEVEFKINRSEKLLKQAMLFVIPSNVGVIITAKEKYSYVTICFKNEWQKQFANLEFLDYFFQLDSKDGILNLCHDFMNKNDEEVFFNSIRTLIIKNVDVKCVSVEKQKRDVVLAASNYINNHIEEKFSLDELAKAIHVSKFHLIRVFKNEMGVTPNQYYIQAKMRIAKRDVFVEATETELAMKLNFSEQSHLCNLFKKQMGISLRDYKNHFETK